MCYMNPGVRRRPGVVAEGLWAWARQEVPEDRSLPLQFVVVPARRFALLCSLPAGLELRSSCRLGGWAEGEAGADRAPWDHQSGFPFSLRLRVPCCAVWPVHPAPAACVPRLPSWENGGDQSLGVGQNDSMN